MGTLYYNGKIITMSHEDEMAEKKHSPEAVLVKDGKIRFAGTYAKARSLASSKVQDYDLKGNCLMPSFIDPHGHIVMNAQMSLLADLSDCKSNDEIVNVMKKYITDHNITPDQAAIGFGYDHNFLPGSAHPYKLTLNEASRDIPILILHVSGHLGCANDAALRIASISSNTPDPEDGVIGRIPESREPSGYLEENALMAAQAALASRITINPAAMAANLEKAYIENGITTAQDGASTENDILFLQNLSSKNLLHIDVVSYPLMTAGGKDVMKKYGEQYKKYSCHLKIGGYKLVLDGSPQGRSAWLSQPYTGSDDDCGYPWLSDEAVNMYVKEAVTEKKQILAHCNGDAASGQFLDAYEKALAETGETEDLRPVMIHCQTVRNDQLNRMAKLRMIASIFIGHVWYWGDVHIKNLGIERGSRISPAKEALSRSVPINIHQDAPVTKPDMLHSVWCAVNRISRGGNVIGNEQKIGVYDALKAVTINAAYEYFEEKEKGSITPGKRADLVILDKSPLDVDPMDIRNIKVLETIKDGNVIYSAL